MKTKFIVPIVFIKGIKNDSEFDVFNGTEKIDVYTQMELAASFEAMGADGNTYFIPNWGSIKASDVDKIGLTVQKKGEYEVFYIVYGEDKISEVLSNTKRR